MATQVVVFVVKVMVVIAFVLPLLEIFVFDAVRDARKESEWKRKQE